MKIKYVAGGLAVFALLGALLPAVAGAETYWSFRGKIGFNFNSPYHLATDSNSNLYVLDDNDYKVYKFDSNGSLVCSVGSQGTGDGQFYGKPNALAVDPAGQFIYVLDGNGSDHSKVVKFSAAGPGCAWERNIGSWGGCSPAADDGKFCAAGALAADASNNIYVFDGGVGDSPSRVQKFSSAGTYLSKWSAVNMRGLTYSGGYLYAMKGSNFSTVAKYTLSGTQEFSFGSYGGGVGQIYTGETVFVSPANIYVADSVSRVQMFDLSGGYVSGIGKFNSPGTGDGEFTTVTGVAWGSNGNLWVADHSGSAYVQKFSTTAYTPPINVGTASGKSSIAYDKDGGLHLVFGWDGSLYYGKWNGVSWSTSAIVTPGGGVATDDDPAIIAIDSHGNPNVAFLDNNADSIKLAKWNGSSWDISIAASESTSVIGLSFALDSADSPHIAYSNKYAKSDGQAWSVYTAFDSGAFEQMAVSAKGIPFIAYWKSGAGLYLSTWTGSGFNSRLVTAEMTGGSFNFTLDVSDNAHFIYTTSGVGTPEIKYIKQTGVSTWSAPEAIPVSVSGYVKIDSLLLDASGNPHFFWQGKHTYKPVASWITEIVEIANEAGDGADATFDTSGKPQTIYGNNANKLLFSQWTGVGYPAVLGGNPRGKLFMPTGLAGAISGSGINWTWTDNAPNETAYRVYGATSPAGPFTQISGDLAPGSAAFLETGLEAGKTYYRYAAAINAGSFVTSGMASVFLTSGETAQVNSLTPAGAFPAASVKVIIDGSGFASGTTVTLKKSGQSDISAAVSFLSSTRLEATFGTSAAVKGAWDVVVAVPGKSVITKAQGFAVLEQPVTPVKVVNGIFEPRSGGKSFVTSKTPSAGHVSVKVYDNSGRLVRTLFEGGRDAGDYTDEWNGNNSDGTTVASGVYLIRIEGPGVKTTKRVLVVK